jgi:hypothetical protein
MGPRMNGLWDDAEVIAVYPRSQAILDGVLVPVTDLVPDEPNFARDAGFTCHVALTSALADLVIPTDAEADRFYQDVKGRLWDTLNMARLYKRNVTDEGGDWLFPCIFWISDRSGSRYLTRNGRRRTAQLTFHLWCSLAPGDDGEPVVTIGFPEDR